MNRRSRSPRLVLAITAAALVAGGAIAACKSDSAGAPPDGGVEGGRRDAAGNCIAPGTPNNEQGVGGYCETNDDCVSGQSLCGGLFGAPDNAWFCTRLCADAPDCGTGMYCVHDPRGIACVPIVCGVEDASDEGTAPSDAAEPGDAQAPSDAAEEG
jgi:hypothetical protein